jgi:hypothetical protein
LFIASSYFGSHARVLLRGKFDVWMGGSFLCRLLKRGQLLQRQANCALQTPKTPTIAQQYTFIGQTNMGELYWALVSEPGFWDFQIFD